MKKRVREKIGLTALNIFFIVLCFVTLIPILYALSVSFSGTNSLLSSDFSFIPKDFTLANYAEVFTGEDIMTWFGNSIVLAAATVAISLLVSVPAAYCFSRRRFPGRRLVLRWLVLLNSFPAILSMFAVYRLLQPMGLINHRLGLIIVYTGTMAVFSLWNMKGYFDTIPLDIEEAARIDGASSGRIFRRITVPLLAPTLGLTMIVNVISASKVFSELFPLFNGNPGSAYSLYTVVYYLFDMFYKQWQLGPAAASAVVLFVIVLIFTMLQLFIQRKWKNY